MKRILSALLAMTLLLSFGGAAAAQSGGEYFTDVPEDAWYTEYVDICYETGLMKGVGNNRFDPDGTMTCAEMLTVCARLHHIFNGGDGNIPELPPVGPKGLIYFTDTNGNIVASFDDLAEWSTSPDGFVVRFEEDVMARLRGGDNPLDAIVLVSQIDEKNSLTALMFWTGRVRPDTGLTFPRVRMLA